MIRFLLLLAVLAAFDVPASAHEVRPAYLEIDETAANRFDVLWKQPSAGMLAVHLMPTISNGLLKAPADEAYSANSFVIRRWKGRSIPRDSFDGATLHVEGLERTITDALVNISFLSGQQIQTLVRPASPTLIIHLTGTGKVPVPTYLTLGIEHILTGFDHLNFVLGLVLLVRGRMRLVKTITAFTVSHSVTLAAAALGYVRVSPPIIESLVALSIVFVAVQLARSLQGYDGLTVRYPWLIAGTFGLLHGVAFAGSLAEIGLPPHNIPGALLLFNCGVEIGQLMFVTAMLLLIAVLRRLTRRAAAGYGRWIAAYGIGVLASYWMFERVWIR